MGLNISFNRQTASNAGLKFKTMCNGSDEDIAFHSNLDNENADPEFLEWLESESVCIRVPYTEFYVEDGGDEENIVVRANKWGRVYEPLTNWLKLNNIPWDEF